MSNAKIQEYAQAVMNQGDGNYIELDTNGMIKNKAVRASMCRAAVQSANQYSNGKKIGEIDVRLLDINPPYQRDRQRHVLKIAENWNNKKCNVLTVSYDPGDGVFHVVDGQHRAAAARMRGVEFLVCEILENMNKSKEAVFFVSQGDDMKKLSPFDTFRANLIISGEDETEISKRDKLIQKVCDSFHIEVKPGNGANRLKSITESRSIVKQEGIEALEWVFNILVRSGWNEYPQGFSKEIMHAIFKQYLNTKGNDEAASIITDFLRTSTPDEVKAMSNNQYPTLGATNRMSAILDDIVSGK